MDRRTFVVMAVGAGLGWFTSVCAQAPATTRRLGFLAMVPRANMDTFLAQLRPELEKLGWTEGLGARGASTARAALVRTSSA